MIIERIADQGENIWSSHVEKVDSELSTCATSHLRCTSKVSTAAATTKWRWYLKSSIFSEVVHSVKHSRNTGLYICKLDLKLPIEYEMNLFDACH